VSLAVGCVVAGKYQACWRFRLLAAGVIVRHDLAVNDPHHGEAKLAEKLLSQSELRSNSDAARATHLSATAATNIRGMYSVPSGRPAGWTWVMGSPQKNARRAMGPGRAIAHLRAARLSMATMLHARHTLTGSGCILSDFLMYFSFGSPAQQ
jgi:hypothetical protein